MGMVGVRVRSERRGARRWLSVVLLLSLSGGAAIVAAQGARRTDTAFARDLEEGRASDVVVNANVLGADQAETSRLRMRALRVLDALDRDPIVIAHGRFGGTNLFVRTPSGVIDQRFNTGSAFGLAAYDADIGHTIARWRIATGRAPDPARADEVLISSKVAALTGWKAGMTLDNFIVATGKDLDPQTGLPRRGRGARLRFHVTGVGDLPEELLSQKGDRAARVYLTPAFTDQHPEAVFYLNEWLRLRDGATAIPHLRARVAADAQANDLSMPIAPTTDGLRNVNQSNDPLVNGLWILAVLAAFVGLILAAQSLGRSFLGRMSDHAQLRALGATRSQRFGMEFATLTVVALTASLGACVVGYLASPLTPVGAARDAEPHPGFSLNVALSAFAFAVLFVGTVAIALVSVFRVSRARQLPGPVALTAYNRPSHAGDLAARVGLSGPAVVGTRFALEPGRGPTATPVRSALASLVLVIAAVTATFAFGVNLQRWTTTPRLYGWNWDVAIGSNFGNVPGEFEQPIAHFKGVAQAAGLTVGALTVNGHTIPSIGITSIRGVVAPAINVGRLPANAHEIVLGENTMRALHSRVGSVLRGSANGKPVTLTVVGTTTFPAFGNERFNLTGLGTGALGIANLFATTDPTSPNGHYNYLLLRYAPRAAATTTPALRNLLARNGCSDPTCLLRDSRPVEITGYRSARDLPLFVGTVFALLLVATLLHVLITTMRRRTIDLAILRAIGWAPRQLRATLRWQALTLTSTALLIGVPAGLFGGRALWRAFTDRLGVAPGITWPIGTILVAAAVVLILTLTLASIAAINVSRRARRYRLSD